MAKNYITLLNDLFPDAVDPSSDPYQEGVRSPSPSVNFVFGNTHLIPFGSSAIFWGPPKGGKSLITNAMVGQLHQDYPDAIALKYNTELRERYQMTDLMRKNLKIDPKRYKGFDTNKPDKIFDHIEQNIPKAVEKGLNIKLVVIDSITDIVGRRTLNADTVNQQQIGDDAKTQADGLKRIKTVLRDYGVTLLMVAQERSVLDPVEIMRGKKTKMAGAFYLQHFAEYFIYVSPNQASEGKSDALGNKFINDTFKDMDGKGEQIAFKTKVKMTASSVGIANRTGEFTYNKYEGIVNTHEEAFKLGVARNIYTRPNNRTYVLKDFPVAGQESKWTSHEDALLAVKNNEEIFKEVVKRVRLRDIDLFKTGITDDEGDAEESLVEGAEPDFGLDSLES